MIEVRCDPDFAEESVGSYCNREFRAEDLDRNLAIVLNVLSKVDGRHTASTKLMLDLIAFGQCCVKTALDIIGQWRNLAWSLSLHTTSTQAEPVEPAVILSKTPLPPVPATVVQLAGVSTCPQTHSPRCSPSRHPLAASASPFLPSIARHLPAFRNG